MTTAITIRLKQALGDEYPTILLKIPSADIRTIDIAFFIAKKWGYPSRNIQISRYKLQTESADNITERNNVTAIRNTRR